MIDHDTIDDLKAAARQRRERDNAIPTPNDLRAEIARREAPSEEEVQRNIASVVQQLRASPREPTARTHGSTALLREVARRLSARGWACSHDEAGQVLRVCAMPTPRGDL